MSDLLTDDERDAPKRKLIDLARLWHELRTYYLLFFAIFGIFLAVTVVVILVMNASYTATAVVGPADNSDQPYSQGALSGLSGGGLGSVVKHLGGGGALGQSGDMFTEYTTLLTSSRLASVLVNKDHILPEIFAGQWDDANHRWLPRDSLLDQGMDFLKGLMRRPVKAAPDRDDLVKYLADKMILETSLETGYATVSLKSGSPADAERLLNLILLEADNIIREDKRRDVAARIAYLDKALQHVMLADQRPELIDILSQQQQEMMMIESDHRYASLLIDPPHAPLKPTSPLPTIDAGLAFLFSWGAWLAALRLTPQSGRWRRLLDKFARTKKIRVDGSQPAGVGSRA